MPVTIVLVDDGGYGMLRFDQAQAGEEPFGVDLVQPDFAALAAAFGLSARQRRRVRPGVRAGAARVGGAATEPQMIVVRAALKPPPTTSPRWYRRT